MVVALRHRHKREKSIPLSRNAEFFAKKIKKFFKKTKKK